VAGSRVYRGLTTYGGKLDTRREKDVGIKRKWQRIVDWTRGLLVPLHEDSGQALAEYSLVLALIAVACVFALTALGLSLVGLLELVADGFP
jgi:Flp pilus assembly pilin Flp